MVDVSELWPMRYGISIYRATMSDKHLRFLLSSFRFDDKQPAPFEEQTTILQRCVTYEITNDKQLMAYKISVSFNVFMKTKLAKYGMKVFVLNDNSTYYLFNDLL